jgi:hypothetical protein
MSNKPLIHNDVAAIPKIPPVKGPEDIVSPCCNICLSQVEEDCDKALEHKERILDTVLQSHEVTKSGSME